jgi:hypothetical protein
MFRTILTAALTPIFLIILFKTNFFALMSFFRSNIAVVGLLLQDNQPPQGLEVNS